MLTSIDRSSPASTTASCVRCDTRMTTVVEMTPSAKAQPKSSNSAMSTAAQIVLFFTCVYPFRGYFQHPHTPFYFISAYVELQLFCIIMHSFGKISKFFHNFLHDSVIKIP